MSDGGGESRKDTQCNSNQSHNKKKSGIDDLSGAIARIAVAQICESSGFQGFQQFALDTLSAVAVRYIQDIGKTANLYANLACRTQCNVFDVIQGLEDLGSVQGFLGASDVHHCLSGSGTVRELIRYVGEAEEIPFVFPLPGFPMVKERIKNYTFIHKGESPPGEHIPSWLPAFPDPETYANMNLVDEKVIQSKGNEADEGGKQRDAGGALTNLHPPQASSGSEPAIAIVLGNDSKHKRTEGSNPFLVSPFQFGEKEVSSIVLPARLSNEAFLHHPDHAVGDHVSAVDTFAPVIVGVKSSDPEDWGKKIPLDMRPVIKFNFGGGKKSFYKASRSQSEHSEKISTWFDDDSEKDDKRRRVEQILKKSVEKPQELTH